MKTFARITQHILLIATVIFTAAGIVVATGVKNAEAVSYTFKVDVPETTVLEVALKRTGTQITTTGGSIDVVPTMSTASFNEIGVDAVIGTSNATGFDLYLNVESSLKDAAINEIIPSLQTDSNHTTGYTCTVATAASCDFPVNTWGYRVNGATAGTATAGTNYLPAPVTDPVKINSYTGQSNGVSTTVYFGSRINAAQKAGSYTTTINFVAIAKIATLPFMQADDLATQLANNSTTNYIGAKFYLYDSRDGKAYKVGKLADGKYWMLDNLALDPRTLVTKLSSSNTNMPAADTANFAGKFTVDMIKNTGFSSYTVPMINVASKDDRQILAMGRSGADATKNIGVYYNYCAASAGTYCMDSNSGTRNASYDICPKGWRMPTGGPSGEYQVLYNATSTAGRNYVDDLEIPRSNYYLGSSVDQSAGGVFWTSTFYSTSNMYTLIADTSGVYLQYARATRDSGPSVRCVLGS